MVDKTLHFKAKTRYNSITIDTETDFRTLRTGNNHLQSRINWKHPEHLALSNLISLTGMLMFIPPPERICLLGVGAGCLIHFFRHHYPDQHITAVEIDGELLEIMHEHMALPNAGDHLTYVVDDAESFLQNNRENFDLILFDLFLGDKSPAWIMHEESIKQVFSMLNRRGGAGYNLLIDSEADFTRFYKKLQSVFQQQALCLAVEDLDNTLAFAFREPVDCQDMSKNLEKAMMLGNRFGLDYMEILSGIYSANPTGAGMI